MRSWHFAGWYFADTEQRLPHPDANGLLAETHYVYKRFGVVTRAETEEDAWANFWACYFDFAAQYRSLRGEKLVGVSNSQENP